MKTNYAFLIIPVLLGISLSVFANDSKTIKSKLTEATVFFRGAELTHTASDMLSKGENEILIEGLSPDVDRNSLKIKTSNGVVVTAYEFSVDYLSDSKLLHPHTKKLQDSLLVYQKQLEDIQTEIDIDTKLLALLQKGTDKNVDGSEKGLAIDELVKTMDYYKNKSKELYKNQTENKRKKQDLNQTIARLNEQIQQESLKNNKYSGILKLTLTSPVAANCNFKLSYYTPSASWVPYYDINIASTDKPVKLTAKSKVRQTTGFDWEKVKLTLSTSTPSNGKAAPLFSAWFLSNYMPQVPVVGMVQKRMMQNSYSYELKESAKIIEEQAIIMPDEEYADSSLDDYVAVAENELNMVYTIDLPYTIPGNGKEQNIDMKTFETQAIYKYYSAPKLDTETYLLAEIADWQKLNLLSGKANVTYDGTYVGESFIDARSTQENLALTLGTDKRVSVKREKMHDYSTKKFLGSDIEQVFTYQLTARNNQNRPVKMVLKDQYPISTQKNIEVKLLTKETTPWTYNVESLGVITWEEELKAGETKTYKISYSVKYPKDSNLNL